jgi:glycerophosphoryl diester phosphodiesterase
MALRLAHRGDSRRAPENTLAAFLAAIAVPGCDGLELDVRASADGVPVVIHDETLKRVQGVDARVDELSAEDLERHGVPSLADVLAAVPRRAFLDVELKLYPGRGAVDALTAGRGPGLERAVISSFQTDALERVGRLAPLWPRWLNARDLSDETIGRAVDLGCRGISVDWRAVDPKAVARVRAVELDLAAWTVRNRPTYGRLERLGVNAICAEGPALDGRASRR